MDETVKLGKNKIVEKTRRQGMRGDMEVARVQRKLRQRNNQPPPYILGSDSPQLLHKDTHTIAKSLGQFLSPTAVKCTLTVLAT